MSRKWLIRVLIITLVVAAVVGGVYLYFKGIEDRETPERWCVWFVVENHATDHKDEIMEYSVIPTHCVCADDEKMSGDTRGAAYEITLYSENKTYRYYASIIYKTVWWTDQIAMSDIKDLDVMLICEHDNDTMAWG